MNSYPECNAVVRTAAAKIVGEARAAGPQKTMGAEDFAFFLAVKPGELSYYILFHTAIYIHVML